MVFLETDFLTVDDKQFKLALEDYIRSTNDKLRLKYELGELLVKMQLDILLKRKYLILREKVLEDKILDSSELEFLELVINQDKVKIFEYLDDITFDPGFNDQAAIRHCKTIGMRDLLTTNSMVDPCRFASDKCGHPDIHLKNRGRLLTVKKAAEEIIRVSESLNKISNKQEKEIYQLDIDLKIDQISKIVPLLEEKDRNRIYLNILNGRS